MAGSGRPESQQVKKIQATAATVNKTGSKVPPIVGPMTHPAPGANLPKNSPRKPPTLGTNLK